MKTKILGMFIGLMIVICICSYFVRSQKQIAWERNGVHEITDEALETSDLPGVNEENGNEKNPSNDKIIPTTTPKPKMTATPKPLPTNTPSPVPTATPEPEPEEAVSNRIIYVGDSRVRSMANISSNADDLWECSNQADYNWFLNTAIPDINNYIGEGIRVVIGIGLNDTYNAASYVALLNPQIKEWKNKGVEVFITSVGPVQTNEAVTNQEIMNFNTLLYTNVDAPYIDVYNYLVSTGFHTYGDGITYDDTTSLQAYTYINSFLRD